MSQHNAKFFSPSLILASAALLIHISVATAADSKVDIPQQAKESRAGTTKAHYALQDGKVSSPTPDAQELARQLLLGSHPSRGASTEPSPTPQEPQWKPRHSNTRAPTAMRKGRRKSFCRASIM